MSRVLLTRPQRDSVSFAARLTQAGHEVLISPVLEIVAAGNPEEIELHCGALLATSAHAFGFLSDEVVQALHSKPLYLVGERTAAVARARGFSDVQCVARDGAELAAIISGLEARPSAMLYLAGRERKHWLERELVRGGVALQIADVYCAHPVPVLNAGAQRALRDGFLDAVMHFSRRSAEIFCALAAQAGLAAQARAIRHICLSQDVARGLTPLGGARMIIAARPDGQSMIEALEEAP